MAALYSGLTPVETAVRVARQRHSLIVAAEQVALGLVLIFGGGILMLLAGTQILQWYWLLLLAGTGFAVGLIRFRKRSLTPYTVAQILDQRLGLTDSLSTAWYLLHDSSAPPADSFAALTQLEQANAAAHAADPRPAFPITGQRTFAAAAVLAMVALSLFGIRYFVTRSLDLKQALIPIQWDQVFATVERNLPPIFKPHGNEKLADARSQNPDGRTEMQDPQLNEVMGVKNPYGSENQSATPNSQKTGAANPENSTPSAEDRKNADSPQGQGAGNNSPDSQQNAPGTQPQQNAQDAKETQGQQQGLLDRMKDAVSSLVSKMRPAAGQQPSQDRQNRDEQSKSAGRQNEQAQAKQPGSQTQQGSEESGAQGEEQSQTTERSQNLQGRSSDKPSEKDGNEAHSGVGRQDGAKDLRDAQQQEAMGKLAEIIGKRSANLTGDVMVEVPNGKQQLHTAYSQKTGKHSDSGGEINRDEVPLMYQQYVREYMEQVHKQAGASK